MAGRSKIRAVAVLGFLCLCSLGRTLPAAALEGPVAVAVSQDGKRVYVNNAYGPIDVIDSATRELVASVKVGKQGYGWLSAVALSPDGARVYVTSFSEQEGEKGSLLVIDPAAAAVIRRVPVGVEPSDLTVSPDGKRVYVANRIENTISAIDTARDEVTGSLALDGSPVSLVAAPDGSWLYVALLADIGVIDPATLQVTATIPVELSPLRLAVSPDGQRLYAAHASGAVSVIDTKTRLVLATTLLPGGNLSGIAVSPEGRRLYVLRSQSPAVFILDADSGAVIGRVSVSHSPITWAFSMAMSPDGAFLYVPDVYALMVTVVDTAAQKVDAVVKPPEPPWKRN
jgi:YVTN family beta-propeller protein